MEYNIFNYIKSYYLMFYLRVDIVAKGFLQLLEDETKNGEAMRITTQNGIDYHIFSKEKIPV